MITAKLSSFSPEEVDEFLAIVNKAQAKVFEKVYCKTQICASCKYRHLCSDLHELSIYLSDEKNDGYPHVKSKTQYSK